MNFNPVGLWRNLAEYFQKDGLDKPWWFVVIVSLVMIGLIYLFVSVIRISLMALA